MNEHKSYRILVVDDSATVRQLIKMVLAKDGAYQLSDAKDGLEALDKVAKGSFDLLITDVNMPNLDGLGLIAGVRNQLQSSIPIIVVTTRGGEKDRDRGMELGANTYLTKPIDGSALSKAVGKTLGRHS